MDNSPSPTFLTGTEVAKLLRVTPETVSRWARQGRLASVVLPGGQRRYPADRVAEIASPASGLKAAS